jgi:signal transduction histidine kinase
MTIRTRMTLWFAAVLTVSLLVMSIGTYIEIAEQMHYRHRHEPDEGAVAETSEMIFEAGLPAVLLGLLGGWWLMRRALAPVAGLTQAVEKINDHNLSQRIPRSGNGDELDRLTDVFNAMTTRLDGSFQHIREFTLHASHELKTPLTILRGELEMALHDAGSSASIKERLASQIDEIERLAKIVDGLTLLTKADAGQIELKAEPLRLDELVRESIADARILAQPHNIEVRLDRCDEVSIRGDRHRLRQLLLNLADNAVKYNRTGGLVIFTLLCDHTSAGLYISNTGAGLAPDLQARVFDRFFRGDASHNSAVEGCGLGLSIAQWIVTAHGGKIYFTSKPDDLTTVSVRLPLG